MYNLLVIGPKDVDNASDELGIELSTHDKEVLYRYVKEYLKALVPEMVFDATCDYVYLEEK